MNELDLLKSWTRLVGETPRPHANELDCLRLIARATATDVTAPTLVSATIPSAGTSITLHFSESVTFGAGGNGGWAISMTGGAATMTYASGSGSANLVYNLNRTVYSGQTGTVSFTQSGDRVEDLSGNDLATLSNFTVTNNSTESPPVLEGATIPSGGDTIELVFSENVEFGAGGSGGWTLAMSGGAATMTYSSGEGTDTLIYDLSRTVTEDETGDAALDYTQPGNGVEDASGNDLESISNADVANNSTQTGGGGGPAFAMSITPFSGGSVSTSPSQYEFNFDVDDPIDDAYLVMTLSVWDSSVSSHTVRWGGSSGTPMDSLVNDSIGANLKLWIMGIKLGNLSAGTKTIAISTGGTLAHLSYGLAIYSGVNQTTPTGTANSATGTSGTASVDVSSATGETVVGATNDAAGTTIAEGAGQTMRYELESDPHVDLGVSDEAGSATTTHSYGFGTSTDWIVGAVPLKPV